MWSRKIDRASCDCSTGPSDRAPSLTAWGRVRNSASTMGTAASTADTAVTITGSSPRRPRNTNVPNRITMTVAIRRLIGRDVVVARR
jgi:hypothetical protein